jgi:TonB family protein
MLKALTLTLLALVTFGCSAAENDRAYAETNPVAPVANEAPPAEPEAPSRKVGVHERGVVNVAVENWGQPIYPDEAKKNKVEGVVLVRVNIQPDGSVSSAKAESGNPILIEAAEEWARGRRIVPHRVGGKSVKSSGILAVKFGK